MAFTQAFTRTIAHLAGAAALALLAACGTTAPANPEVAVRERAQQRWDAMRADQFDKAYTFNTPSYREVQDFAGWRRKYGAAELWSSAKVDSVNCEQPERCKVIVMIAVKNVTPIRTKADLSTAIEETWVKEGANWYFLQPT